MGGGEVFFFLHHYTNILCKVCWGMTTTPARIPIDVVNNKKKKKIVFTKVLDLQVVLVFTKFLFDSFSTRKAVAYEILNVFSKFPRAMHLLM